MTIIFKYIFFVLKWIWIRIPAEIVLVTLSEKNNNIDKKMYFYAYHTNYFDPSLEFDTDLDEAKSRI